jgi:hypothetical protein
MRLTLFGLGVATALVAAPVQAATIGLTLTSDKDPLTVADGETITFTVGIENRDVDPATPDVIITGYTLDIVFNTDELVSPTDPGPPAGGVPEAEPLATWLGGVPFPFLLHPVTTPATPGLPPAAGWASARASVLQTNDSDPLGALFSMTFTVRDPHADGIDLRVGILFPPADAINPPLDGDPFTIDPAMLEVPIHVPEPTGLPLIAAPLVGLIALRRRQHRPLA